MVIALTTDSSNPRNGFVSVGAALVWKAWQESRGRFFSASVLLVSLVVYAVVRAQVFSSATTRTFLTSP